MKKFKVRITDRWSSDYAVFTCNNKTEARAAAMKYIRRWNLEAGHVEEIIELTAKELEYYPA